MSEHILKLTKAEKAEKADLEQAIAFLRQCIDDLQVVKSGRATMDRYRMAANCLHEAWTRCDAVREAFNFDGTRKVVVEAELVEDEPPALFSGSRPNQLPHQHRARRALPGPGGGR